MNKIFLTLSITVIGAVAIGCGLSLTNSLRGDKVLPIELTPQSGMFMSRTEGSEHRYALDDDGMLAVGFVASYCNQGLQDARVDLTQDQQTCASKAQEDAHIDIMKRIFGSYYGNAGPESGSAITVVSEKCHVDVQALYREAQVKSGQQEVTCAPLVSRFVQKAASRFAAYAREVTETKRLAQMGLDAPSKAILLDHLKTGQAALNQLASMTKQTPLLKKDWDPWVKKFMDLADNESFQQVTSLDQPPDDKAEPTPLKQVLRSVNSTLPGIPRMRCGFGMSEDAIKKLIAGDWEAGPATTTSPSKSGGTGASGIR